MSAVETKAPEFEVDSPRGKLKLTLVHEGEVRIVGGDHSAGKITSEFIRVNGVPCTFQVDVQLCGIEPEWVSRYPNARRWNEDGSGSNRRMSCLAEGQIRDVAVATVKTFAATHAHELREATLAAYDRAIEQTFQSEGYKRESIERLKQELAQLAEKRTRLERARCVVQDTPVGEFPKFPNEVQ